MKGEIFDTAIIGAGPSGIAASIFASSEGLRTLLVEKHQIGGQIADTSRIENYLGFPLGLAGRELMHYGHQQARKFGTRVRVPARVVKLVPGTRLHELELESGELLRARSVVIATGGSYRTLDQHRSEFERKFIHFAATSEQAQACAGQNIAIIGGGNSAGQAAVYLSDIAKHVYLIVRRDSLSATMSKYLIDRINASDKIELITECEVKEILGEEKLEGLRLSHRRLRSLRYVFCSQMFCMIGTDPRVEFCRKLIERDDKDFILTDQRFQTSLARVFAVGDVRSGSLKRVASATGEGASVISYVHQALA